MAGKELTLKSGAKLSISHAPFEDACALYKAVLALSGKSQGVDDATATMKMFCDPEIYRLAFKCAEKAIYCGRKIDAALFDDAKLGEQASSDLVELFSVLVSFNVDRFFQKASSALGAVSPVQA